MECPKCKKDVSMKDISYIDNELNQYAIWLECAKCEWQFHVAVSLDILMPVEPVRAVESEGQQIL